MSKYQVKLTPETRSLLLNMFPPAYRFVLGRQIIVNFPDVELVKILGIVDNGNSLQTLLVKVECKTFPTESASGCILWSSDLSLKQITEKDLRKFAFYKPVEPIILWPSSFEVSAVAGGRGEEIGKKYMKII